MRVGCQLVRAQNALLCQSRKDALGRCHPDGWGLAFYRGSTACVIKHAKAAFDDMRFSESAERVASRTLVAHVRLASVGRRSSRNTHPFRIAPFVFAHNGTLLGIDVVTPEHATLREQLRSELVRDAVAESFPLGNTDSELIFGWLLSRLWRSRQASLTGFVDPHFAAEVVASAVVELDQRSREAGAASLSKLNLLLTDGRTMIATRHRHDLYWMIRDAMEPCDVCGQIHAEVPRGERFRSVAIASEPASGDPWQEIPDESLVLVDPELGFEMRSTRQWMRGTSSLA